MKFETNDLDVWMNAMENADLSEFAAPIVRGRMLVEDEQVDYYNKILKLLNCDVMESCHGWLYNLDPLELSESECHKLDKLITYALDKGFIKPEVVGEKDEDGEEDSEEESTDECDNSEYVLKPVSQLPTLPSGIRLNQNAFTVIYSAMRDGQIKSGEAYSNCTNTRSAKADVISKLERAGYQNVSILAIEAGDPDMQGCDNTYCAQADHGIPDYANEADEDSALNHALDPVGVKASTANLKKNNAVEMTMTEKDDEEGKEDEADDKSDDSAEDSSSEEKDTDKDTEKTDDEDSGKADEKSEDKEDEDKEDEDKPEKKEDSEEPDEKLKDDAEEKSDSAKDDDSEDGEELSAAEKESLKDSYKKAFKAALEKGKYKMSFSELSLDDKIKFFTDLSKVWKNKADPSKFMTDKETDQLEKIVVKK